MKSSDVRDLWIVSSGGLFLHAEVIPSTYVYHHFCLGTCTKLLWKIMTFQKLAKTHFSQYLVYFSK